MHKAWASPWNSAESMAFDQTTRNRLQRFVNEVRKEPGKGPKTTSVLRPER